MFTLRLSVGDGEAQNSLRAVEQLCLAQATTVGCERRHVNEEDRDTSVLPGRPIERKIIQEVTEVASRRARRGGGDAALAEMSRKRCCRKCGVEPPRSLREDDGAARQSARSIGAEARAIVSRTLDAKSLRAMAQTKVNRHMRLERLAKLLRDRRHCLPLGGKDTGVHLYVSLD